MDPFKPSAYVPFLRRFTNERQRELDEAEQLYVWVEGRQRVFKENATTIGRRVAPCFRHVSEDLFIELAWVMHELISAEAFLQTLPAPSFDRMNMEEFVKYRSLLEAKQYFFVNQAEILERFEEGLSVLLGGLSEQFPLIEDPSPFTIPLVYTLQNPGLTVDQIFGSLWDEPYRERGLFRRFGDLLYRNRCMVAGNEPYAAPRRPWRYAVDSTMAIDEVVATYLAHSPFHDLLLKPVSLKLTHQDRFSHMHIVGGTGAGKTSLIENLVLHDLQSDDPPSLVIIDPHGDLIRKLTHADLGLEDRLVIIDPRDIKFPPALNVFALNQERLATYDEVTREQVTAGVIQTFDYLFSGLVGADLTAKQGVFFRYVARLMLALPETMGRNATIIDLIRLMSDATPYAAAIEALPEIPREFFMRDFASKTFGQTKEQIRYRLQAIIENPTLARLFTSPDTKIDLFTEMNRGSIILVDTAKDFLKSGSSNFGRIFISLVLQAILERAAIPERHRTHTFLIIDEAASYFDSNIDDLLTDVRKYNCGCLFAHQYLDQASASLRASLAANTGAKFASNVSSSDARSMATDMRTTPDFILNQPRLQFAAHIRGVTPQAVSIPVEPGAFDRVPQLSPRAYERLIEHNRQRVSFPSAPLRLSSPPAPPSPPSPADNEDISSEW